MSTPNKHTVKAAEMMPALEDFIKSLVESNVSLEQDFNTMVRRHSLPDEVKQGFARQREIINKAYSKFKEIDYELRCVDNTTRQAYLFVEDEIAGKHKIENYDINTSLYNKAPKLTPRVGYDEAMRHLNKTKPKGKNKDMISSRQLAGCLGQVGSESHIVEYWNVAEPEDRTRGPIKTNGILNPTADGMIYFTHAKEFLKRLYENYYVGLITGNIIAISNQKSGKVVRFMY